MGDKPFLPILEFSSMFLLDIQSHSFSPFDRGLSVGQGHEDAVNLEIK